MNWIDTILDGLAGTPAIGYARDGQVAAEATAVAALALVAHARHEAAFSAATKLVEMQQSNGEVAVRLGEDSPGWPTSLAVVAWCAVENAGGGGRASAAASESAERHRDGSLQEPAARAIQWLLANRGRGVEQSEDFGHNTQLVGWAYAEGTHSWVEPTAFAVLAMKSALREQEAPAREGVAVLINRQLPGGGLNYGNTYVLGQLIRPHVQPTGIGLLALVGENDPSGRIAKSVAWLRRSIGPQTTPTSLAWATLGLAAHDKKLPMDDDWLANAAERVKNRDDSPYKLALLALAARGLPR